LAGLTQQQLAMRANLSLSLVRKVEQGVVPASPTCIASVAQALHLLVTDLTEQSHFASVTSRHGTELESMPDLERAITEYEDPSLSGSLMSIEEAAQGLAAVVNAGRRSRYTDVLEVLPGLLRNLHALSVVVARQEDRAQVGRLLTQAYQSAMFVAYKFGHLTLSAWAAERMCRASESSDDPLWAIMAQYCRAQTLMFGGSYRASDAVLHRASAEAEASRDPRSFEVRGAIHLSSAIIAARLGKADDSDLHLTEARDLARHILPGDHFDTAFSAANVDIHSVSAAVEMSDGTAAINRGADLQLQGKLYSSRLGHYHIDLARAWLLHGDHERSIKELQKARQLSPQQTRYHPQVQETIRVLARARRRADPIARLAAWAGLQEG
jgi:transcriptional regulator with XRE-family HTH domain